MGSYKRWRIKPQSLNTHSLKGIRTKALWGWADNKITGFILRLQYVVHGSSERTALPFSL